MTATLWTSYTPSRALTVASTITAESAAKHDNDELTLSKSFVTSLFAMLSAGRSLIVLHMDIRAKEVDVVVEVASQMREPTGNRILQAHMRPAWGPQSLRTTHPVFMFQHGARAAL